MNSEAKWYAIRVLPRQEKKVQKVLDIQNIENYLPIKEEIRQWSDRKKKVETPIISGYLFVKITMKEREVVYSTDGVSKFVSNAAGPISIPEDQIERLRFMVKRTNGDVEFTEIKVVKGDSIRVISGNLEGLIGTLKEVQGKYKVVIQIEGLGSARVSVPVSMIERI
ncbi:MAG: UpxY family transcription antiterminator [Marinifilaceae bacterium]